MLVNFVILYIGGYSLSIILILLFHNRYYVSANNILYGYVRSI